MEDTAARENGKETLLPTYKNHLLCGDDGTFPAIMNEWERKVLATESARNGFASWYRMRIPAIVNALSSRS
jgi:type III restriction enzyme